MFLQTYADIYQANGTINPGELRVTSYAGGPFDRSDQERWDMMGRLWENVTSKVRPLRLYAVPKGVLGHGGPAAAERDIQVTALSLLSFKAFYSKLPVLDLSSQKHSKDKHKGQPRWPSCAACKQKC